MADNNTLIAISAFSGLAGAMLTQTLTGLFAYFNDKRKYNNDVKAQFRTRKTEIGESFYYITGEKMAIVNKNIGYWKNWNNSRSEASLEFMNKEMIKLNSYMEKLDADSWKFNLINLYFNVSLTNEILIEANARSKQLYLKVIDIVHQFKTAGSIDKEQLYGIYAIAIFDMCSHYEDLYLKMQQDMNVVKTELLNEFKNGSIKYNASGQIGRLTFK